MKRVFSGFSSSMEADMSEIAPQSVDHLSKLNSSSKAKGKNEVESNKKTKVSMGISFGSDSAKVESNKKGKEVAVEPVNTLTAGPNNFFDFDDYVREDDFSALQSYFDSIDIPPGIEAPIPCFENLSQTKKKPPANPLVTSHGQPNRPHVQLGDASQLKRTDSFFKSSLLSSRKEKPSVWNATAYVNLNDFDAETTPSSYAAIGSGFYLSGNSNNEGVDMNGLYSTEGMFTGTENGGIYSTDDMFAHQDAAANSQSLISSSFVESSSTIAKLSDGDVVKRYESFKKFDTVVDFSDHVYSKQNSAMDKPPKNWAKKIQEEWRILEKDLPDTIFARVYESRMDLLRAVIIGAEGTPYHDGLFFFDVCFPSNYPNSPPLVGYHSRGLDINPNLYSCGKVCLSLLNTWHGDCTEMWVPGTSTMLQVLVSIQGLILNTKPYFNEPAFAYSSGSFEGEKSSVQYNENTLISSLKTMVYTMNKPPKNFEDLVVGHFRSRVRDILLACKAYTEGLQVGCFTKGTVQNVDELKNSCSAMFKTDVALYVKTLISAFNKIGAKEADEFISLSEKKGIFHSHDWIKRYGFP